MHNTKNCPICGATSFKKVYEAPYFRGEREVFTIEECNNCALWITNPRPEDKDLGKYYQGDYVSHTEDKGGLINKIYLGVRNFAVKSKVKLINKLHPRQGMLLDYGAGTGFFIKAAENAGWQVEGVEPSAEARALAARRGTGLADPEKFAWREQHYDVITLWHVLEHLPNLQEHFSQFAQALRNGGHLIIAVPNHESLDSKYYAESWAALDVPLHLYHFKKKNIQELAQQHKLEVEEIRNMPFDAFYVSMLSEKIKNDKSNIWRAISKGMQSNLAGRTSQNASSLIYILKKPH